MTSNQAVRRCPDGSFALRTRFVSVWMAGAWPVDGKCAEESSSGGSNKAIWAAFVIVPIVAIVAVVYIVKRSKNAHAKVALILPFARADMVCVRRTPTISVQTSCL